mmetsp:Transcript_3890/g.24644  ORF Transcript_3890/g.24644 Transcript_3890/m.24644 type:complete len:133 (-) Transcript_3890:968-1366(-)
MASSDTFISRFQRAVYGGELVCPVPLEKAPGTMEIRCVQTKINNKNVCLARKVKHDDSYATQFFLKYVETTHCLAFAVQGHAIHDQVIRFPSVNSKFGRSLCSARRSRCKDRNFPRYSSTLRGFVEAAPAGQ